MDLRIIQEKIGYSFKSAELLERALAHGSFANETGCPDNQRLEFLGDSVLGLITSEFLFDKFPHKPEGELSAARAGLVSSGLLGRKAGELGLGSHIFLGRGEERSGGRERESILAGAFEAVCAAIYLDGGIESARDFIVRVIAPEAERLGTDPGRFKCLLQEYAQSEFGMVPDYRVADNRAEGDPERFSAEVSLRGRTLGRGKGRNRKEAETAAAGEAVQIIRKAGETA